MTIYGGAYSGGGVSPYGGGGSTSGAVDLSGSSRPSIYTPSSGGAAAAAAAPADPFNGPGAVDISLTDPSGSLQRAGQESSGVLSGLARWLFGSNRTDLQGSHGGVLGNVPVIGDIGRAATNVVGDVGTAALGAASHIPDVVGGALERIPAPIINGGMSTTGAPGQLQSQFDAIPDSSPAKQAALAQMQKDQGFLGTGLLSGKDTYMSRAIQQYGEEQNKDHPDLWRGTFRPVASIADEFGNLLGGFLTAQEQGVQRAMIGVNDGQRLQQIKDVAEGRAAWSSTDKKLNPIEQVVYDHLKDNSWTSDEALNYLAVNHAGFAHDAIGEMAHEILFDPLTWETLGVGELLKVPQLGMRLNALAKTADETLAAAKAADALNSTSDTVKAVQQAEKAVENAKVGIDMANKNDIVGARNILGRMAKTEGFSNVARSAGSAYEKYLVGSNLGTTLKIMRTVVDPMHVIGEMTPVAKALEVASPEVTQAFVKATGEGEHAKLLDLFANRLGETGVTDLQRHIAMAAGNSLKRVVGRSFRAVQMNMANVIGMGAEALNRTASEGGASRVFQFIEDAAKGARQDVLTQVQEEANHFRKFDAYWAANDGQANLNLAKRLSRVYGRETDEWLTDLKSGNVSSDMKSLLHQATYTGAIEKWHLSKQAVRTSGEAINDTAQLFLDRGILLNKDTLTDIGLDGIRTRLAAAVTPEAKVAVMQDAQRLYPSLYNFTSDPTSASETIKRFIEHLDRMAPSLPHQIENTERAGLPTAMAEFDRLISAEPDNVFTLGLRPKDEFLWGLDRDVNGALHVVGDPWFDQSSHLVGTYSPVRALEYNVAGQPIPARFAQKALRLVDNAQMAGSTMLNGVTGAMVKQTAHNKFVQGLVADYGPKGMSQRVATDIWNALMKAAEDNHDISSVRGLSKGGMWKAAKTAMQPWMRTEGLDPHDLMMRVLTSWEGDVRQVGLTQKFTGSLKTLVAQMTNRNTMGVVSEHAWPLLKFRLNPLFQLQEKIEPFILNGQRGVSLAFGQKLTAEDRLTATIMKNMVEKNIVNLSDNDIAELTAKFNLQKEMDAGSQAAGSRMAWFRGQVEGMLDVQGTKAHNMMRTWAHGLGREMKAIWERNMPGEWERILQHEQGLTGTLLSDDELAIRMAAENQAANDVVVRHILANRDGTPLQAIEAHFENAIREGQWAAPGHLGELRPLNMDHALSRMSLHTTDGQDIEDVAALKRALAEGKIDPNEVNRALRTVGAHEDYAQRFNSALRFSWDGFWKSVKDTYSLTDEQTARFQSMYAEMAQRLDMTPLEYMSQVYSPIINGGTEAGVGSLGALVKIARDGDLVPTPQLATLAGTAGTSTIDDLYMQMAKVMSHHLQPSAKLAFLERLAEDAVDDRGMLNQGHDLADLVRYETNMTSQQVTDMFTANGGDEALAQQIIDFVRGTPGTGTHRIIDPAAEGVPWITQAADERLIAHGRPPALMHAQYEDDAALAQELANEFQNYGHEFRQVATEADLSRQVDFIEAEQNANDAAVHGSFSGMSSEARVWANANPAAQDMIGAYGLESRSLYHHIVSDMGITIIPTPNLRPYATSSALRSDLANHRLLVPDHGYYDPIYGTEDAMMQSVVHQVFGHGTTSNEFGSHDAWMHSTRMYSDEARKIGLNKFAQQAWESSDQSIIPAAVERPETMAEAQATFGLGAPAQGRMALRTPSEKALGLPGTLGTETRVLGNGFHLLEDGPSREAIGAVSDIRRQFDTPVGTIDIFPGSADHGVTFVPDRNVQNGILTVVHRGDGWVGTDAERAAKLSELERQWNYSRVAPVSVFGGGPRLSNLGVPSHTGYTPQSVLYHEFGHVLFENLDRNGGVPQTIKSFLNGFARSNARKEMSEYGMTSRDEMVAELFDLAFNPEHGQELLVGEYDPQLTDYVDRFKQMLKDEGIWQPDRVLDPAAHPLAPYVGMTTSEARAAGATVVVPQRIGAISDDLSQRLAGTFLGNGRYHAANPDVARLSGFLHDNIQMAVAHLLSGGTTGGDANGLGQLLREMSNMPVDPAQRVPFNFSQAQLWNAAVGAMAAKWQDAFRLQYFAQNRSMFQRSLNHPMFGLYPASYMWGKIGPELIHFMAAEPFGLKTGGLGMTLAKAQLFVAARRQADPAFQKQIDGMGKSAALSFLGYMLPATPWSVPSSYPSWMRDIAQQGNANENSIAGGGDAKDANFVTPLTAIAKRAVPMTTQLPWMNRAAGEVGNLIFPKPDRKGARIVRPIPVPVTAPASNPTTNLNAPTAAVALGPIVSDQMRTLAGILAP